MSAHLISDFASRIAAAVNNPDQYPSKIEILNQIAMLGSVGQQLVDIVVACVPDFVLALNVLEAIYETFPERFSGNYNLFLVTLMLRFDSHYLRLEDLGFVIGSTIRGKQLLRVLEDGDEPAAIGIADMLWLLNDSVSRGHIRVDRLIELLPHVEGDCDIAAFRDFIVFVTTFARGCGPRLGFGVDNLPTADYRDGAVKAEIIKRAGW